MLNEFSCETSTGAVIRCRDAPIPRRSKVQCPLFVVAVAVAGVVVRQRRRRFSINVAQSYHRGVHYLTNVPLP